MKIAPRIPETLRKIDRESFLRSVEKYGDTRMRQLLTQAGTHLLALFNDAQEKRVLVVSVGPGTQYKDIKEAIAEAPVGLKLGYVVTTTACPRLPYLETIARCDLPSSLAPLLPPEGPIQILPPTQTETPPPLPSAAPITESQPTAAPSASAMPTPALPRPAEPPRAPAPEPALTTLSATASLAARRQAAIDAREAALASREALIAEREKLVAQAEAELAEREAALLEIETRLAEKESEQAVESARIRDFERTSADRIAQITARELIVNNKENELTARAVTVDTRERQLSETEAELKQQTLAFNAHLDKISGFKILR